MKRIVHPKIKKNLALFIHFYDVPKLYDLLSSAERGKNRENHIKFAVLICFFVIYSQDKITHRIVL